MEWFCACINNVIVYSSGVAEKTDPPVGVVVATGLVLVFSILVLLYLILLLEGRIFNSIDAKRESRRERETKAAEALKAASRVHPSSVPTVAQATATQAVAPPAVYTPPPSPVPTALAPPRIEEGIPPEIVAAIAGAIDSFGEGKYTLSSVKMVPKGRGQWGLAGVIEHTESF